MTIKSEDVQKISLLLFKSQLLIPGFKGSEENIYEPTTYLKEKSHFGTQAAFLLDRNIVSRCIALVTEKVKTSKIKHTEYDQYCLVAAIMAFAQYADILIEPNIALYELAMTEGNSKANGELQLLRIADNIPAQK